MANRVFTSDLSVKGLRQLKKDLRAYQRQTLPGLLKRYIDELADVGIYIAKISAGYSEFAPYIGFYKETQDTKYAYQYRAIMVGKNAIPCFKRWYRDNKLIEREVNALMMAEYGSGQFALPGHRGTFPRGDDKKSKGLRDVWWYATEKDGNDNYVWQMAQGDRPAQPMLNARDAIIRDADLIARRVFG